MHLSEHDLDATDPTVTGRRLETEEYTAEDAILAQRFLDILRDMDPDAFLGADIGRSVAIDGHWHLPTLIQRIRKTLGPDREAS